MTNDIEEWRPVYGFEGVYEVSNKGKVRSLDRESNGGRFGPYRKKGMMLSPQARGEGYLGVNLMSGKGNKKYFLVHRLVALAFLGSTKKGAVVDHKDGDRSNNHLENLEFVSMRENICRGKLSLKRKNKKCASRGVTVSKWNRYIASIRIKGKAKYLGSYGTEHEASMAYEKAFCENS